MKNVEEVSPARPVFKVRLKGAPPPKGWAIRYKSGAEERPDIQPGELLSQWSVDRGGITFNFSPDRADMFTFDNEEDAVKAVEWLRNDSEIETEVLKVG